jgi:hypothetical protein
MPAHTRLISLFAIVFLLAVPGCWCYTPAHPQPMIAAAPLPADAWPKRDPEAVRPIYEATPDKVYSYRVIEGADADALSDQERRWVEEPEYVVSYKGLHANGLLRIFEEPSEADGTPVRPSNDREHGFIRLMNELFLGFDPNAHIMSSRTLDAGTKRVALEQKLEPLTEPIDASLSIIRSEGPAPRIEAIEQSHQLHLDDGLAMRIPPPNPRAPKPRGLILHLHAIAGNSFEPQVIKEFRDRNWAVIDFKTESTIECPIPESWYAEIASLSAESRDLARKIFVPADPSHPTAPEDWKSLQRRTASNPLYPRYKKVEERLAMLRAGGFQACTDEDLPDVAEAVAHEIDDGLAGASYAVQAVLEYIKQERPDLQGIPVVMMGFSAGALATPTAAARVHDQLDAVVIIGGGCDLFRISQESSFTDAGLKVRCGENKVSRATIDRIDELYLQASKLDPYHTAPLIADLPILQLHGSTDTWVPYPCGNLLYERLNYPDRLTIGAGHEALFYFLPGKKEWIADWVENAVTRRRRQLSAMP